MNINVSLFPKIPMNKKAMIAGCATALVHPSKSTSKTMKSMKSMKSILATTGILAASIAAASAISITRDTVGVMNTNAHTILDATGSISNTTFASSMTTAFANNTGGVWNFDAAAFTVASGETITLNYGTSQTNSLVMTLSSASSIDQGTVSTAEATSSTTAMGLPGNFDTRTFTLSAPVLTIGIFVGNRGDSTRTSVLTVTYQDTTTASTSGATAGPAAGSNYFEGLSGTLANPIVSFSIAQNNYIRYDDLGFIAVPEPATGALLLGGGGMLVLARRRRAGRRC